MTIVPTGAPLWAYTTTLEDYGGNLEKRNYMDRGAIDAISDIDARQFARLTADVYGIGATSPLCTLSFECRDTPASVPRVTRCQFVTGVELLPYDGDRPPDLFGAGKLPKMTRLGDGAVEVTFAESYRDDYAIEAPYIVRGVEGTAYGDTVQILTPEIVSATVVRVRIFDFATKAPVPNAKGMISVR